MRLSFARWLVIGILAALLVPADASAQVPLGRLSAPPGFAIEVFAEVPGARSLAVAERGARVYVGTQGERVFAVLDPERDGRANEVVEVAHGLKVPNGVALAPDGALFVVEQHQITRFDPSGERKVVVPPGILPDFRHHGWRYAAFGPDRRLYVTIGAPCNICEVRGFEGTIVRLREDGHEVEIFARGVRNSLGLDWHPRTGELFFTDNGGDQLGDLIPPDELNRAPEPDLHFGYPYVYGPGQPYPEFAGAEAARPVHPSRGEFRCPRRRARPALLSRPHVSEGVPTRCLRGATRLLESQRTDRLPGGAGGLRYDRPAERGRGVHRRLAGQRRPRLGSPGRRRRAARRLPSDLRRRGRRDLSRDVRPALTKAVPLSRCGARVRVAAAVAALVRRVPDRSNRRRGAVGW